MKTPFLFIVLLSTLLLVGTGCPKQNTTTSLPPAVNELQTQTVPKEQKQSVSKRVTESTKNDLILYGGSWFDIEYPKKFTANPIIPTDVYKGMTRVHTDEAYFASPDGAVEFFVFSPLWSGDPADYLTVRATEELISEKNEENGSNFDKKVIRWVTIKAKDMSYYRSFVSIKEQVGTGSDLHHVFGIKYKDNEAYERYRDAYIAFKESLRQYGD